MSNNVNTRHTNVASIERQSIVQDTVTSLMRIMAVVVCSIAGQTTVCAQWEKVDIGVSSELLGIHFFSPLRGIINGTQNTMRLTTDGGETWTTPEYPDVGILADIDFVDSLVGWISTPPGLLMSTNGGDTWSLIPIPGHNGGAISFVDREYGWAGGGSYVSSSGWISRTTDGGVTWTPQVKNLDADIIRISFFDRSAGCAVGSFGRILWTDDGGENWRECESPTGSYIYWVQMLSPNEAMASAEGGGIIKTTDAGLTWRSMQSGTGGHTLALSMYQKKWGLVAGSSGLIRRSIDSGETWQDDVSPTGVTSMYDCQQYCYLRAVLIIHPELAWAVGQGGGVFRYRGDPTRVNEINNAVNMKITYSIDEQTISIHRPRNGDVSHERLRIVNSVGEVVVDQMMTNSNVVVYVPSWPSGVYHISITPEAGRWRYIENVCVVR